MLASGPRTSAGWQERPVRRPGISRGATARVHVRREHERGGAGVARIGSLDDPQPDVAQCGLGRTPFGVLHGSAVEKDSTVITDGLSAYRSLSKRGYEHKTFNLKHEKKQNGLEAHELMPACASGERTPEALDTRDAPGRGLERVVLDYYLGEFAFRYNRRYSRHPGLLFYRLAEQAMATEPKPYAELLTPPASKARKRKVKRARKMRAAGKVGSPVNVSRAQQSGPAARRRS